MKIQEHVLLAPHTTFRIGGVARYFSEVQTIEELKEAILYARTRGVPFFILGGGSNVLFSDDGFDGLVIKINIQGISWKQERDGSVVVTARAAEKWDDFVERAIARGLYGIENLSAIPGTVGAAPIQNIGAYGQEASETIKWVDILDAHTLETQRLTHGQCLFGYRESVFKKELGKKYIVVSVAFCLQSNGVLNHSYSGITEYFEMQKILKPTLADTRKAIIALRAAKLPDISAVGTAGSFFKNPVVSPEIALYAARAFPEMPARKINGAFKISAAWLIENVACMKGARAGDAGTHGRQPLVFVNYKNARASDILALAEKAEKIIFKKTGIKLEREVRVVKNKK